MKNFHIYVQFFWSFTRHVLISFLWISNINITVSNCIQNFSQHSINLKYIYRRAPKSERARILDSLKSKRKNWDEGMDHFIRKCFFLYLKWSRLVWRPKSDFGRFAFFTLSKIRTPIVRFLESAKIWTFRFRHSTVSNTWYWKHV